MTLRVLELFSGEGSVKRFCALRPDLFKVTSLDFDPKTNPDILVDVIKWNYKKHCVRYDIIWGSPDCRNYSNAHSIDYNKDVELSDKIVSKTLEIIYWFKPKFWFIENPAFGQMVNRPVMRRMTHSYVVDYCKYGWLFRKPTRIWTNVKNFVPKTCNRDCAAIVNGRHAMRFGAFDEYSIPKRVAHRVPQELIRDLFHAAYPTLGLDKLKDFHDGINWEELKQKNRKFILRKNETRLFEYYRLLQ